jgi:hypothetical protein
MVALCRSVNKSRHSEQPGLALVYMGLQLEPRDGLTGILLALSVAVPRSTLLQLRVIESRELLSRPLLSILNPPRNEANHPTSLYRSGKNASLRPPCFGGF